MFEQYLNIYKTFVIFGFDVVFKSYAILSRGHDNDISIDFTQ